MKFFLLAGVAAATLMAQAAEATTFSYTGSVVQWIVPTTGRFRIVASGAQGGFGFNYAAGGQGVSLSGIFALNSGQQLSIAVGQMGFGASTFRGGGGGGGGSFVLSGASALLIAGGGGGARDSTQGGNANSGTAGGSTYSAGGQDGAGGGAYTGSAYYNNPVYAGGGGAGLLSNGTNSGGSGGSSLPTLAGGGGAFWGGNGGFGGGGGGGFGAGGGGGGFSGGAGGLYNIGGGGGSFNAGTDQQFLGFNSGDGSVSIQAVPEPSIWSMLISGFGLVGFALRRRLRMVVQAG